MCTTARERDPEGCYWVWRPVNGHMLDVAVRNAKSGLQRHAKPGGGDGSLGGWKELFLKGETFSARGN